MIDAIAFEVHNIWTNEEKKTKKKYEYIICIDFDAQSKCLSTT